jgi:SAM-dependent methyltransferase
MDEKDLHITLNRYNRRLEQFGYSEETLGWSRNKNNIRFKALISEWIDELEGSSIADWGCGFGDLFGYIKNTLSIKNIGYTGIDINEKLVEKGRELYPEANFWIGNIEKENPGKKFDFIFSSGVFNHKLENSDEYLFIEASLKRLNELALKGIAVNFLSDKVDFEHPHTFHSNPGKILEMCYGFSRNIVFKNDYMPFEFTVYIRKDKQIDPEKIVYI